MAEPLRRLQDRVAIITGGGAGIGEACCRLFAAEGATVVCADINDDNGRAVVKSIVEQGGRAHFIHADVGIEEDIVQLVERSRAEFNSIDILVNNAGIELFKNATDTTTAEWTRCIDVDLRGVWLCCKYVLPGMVEQGKGSIVNISSVHAIQTLHNIAAYAAAKGGVLAMTRNMALDYAPAVRINAILPGYIATTIWDRYVAAAPDPEKLVEETIAIQPMKRLGTPLDIAQGALFLASDDASWITGAGIVIDGGMTARLHH